MKCLTTRLFSSRKRVYWICISALSVAIIVTFSHATRRNVTIMGNVGLGGYVRITSGQMDQYLDVRCKECALVSSSGQMLKAGKGKEIDNVDCVIRMNNAPVEGYEHDVGRKTSLRVVSHTSVPLILKNEPYYFQHSVGTVYVVWGPEKNMRQDGKGRIFNVLLKAAEKYPLAKIYVVTRERVEYCDGLFQNETGKNRMQSGAYLSTGFFTMVLAMEICDSIQVYGMISDDYCSQANRTSVPYHYYEKGRMDECRMYRAHEKARRSGHRFITEKTIYGRWASRKKIHFHHPSWTDKENIS